MDWRREALKQDGKIWLTMCFVCTVLLKCRDRDGSVREQARAILAQFPMGLLAEKVSAGDWRAVFDVGLSADGDSQASAKDQIMHLMKELMQELLQEDNGLMLRKCGADFQRRRVFRLE